ncbi:class I SAM-dependent methyltransferase [Cohnella candidum]|uniref:Class I SAM-dependent methyltransferase n=1 Tax=Cohnella candidum TaxID=2674991 RepID=A0A3G3K4U3_9BACL|nr:class I SAM-dependent methyltransferase [Cohnella candidum]AYQ75191.1 class I SAM-dependent methyltransferase [Cohnella candidum]
MNKENLARKFDKQAKAYERRRKQLTQNEWRERLICGAKGMVLEVGVGAGGNFPYYPKDVIVTAVDFSKEMLSSAKEAASELGVRAEFVLSDIESCDFPEGSFDTIVSTLTLCGYKDPIAMLNKFNKWTKADGQILLMEHGTSSNGLIRSIQKAVDPLFLKVVGCHQNRDMEHLFQKSGIHIIKAERHFMNMVHLVWAKPNKNNVTI